MALRTSSRKKSRYAGNRPFQRHDAVTLLEDNHRTMRRLLSRFARCREAVREAELARRICAAAAVHARLEDEILAPAFLAHGGDAAIHHRAEVTRNTCTMLIASFGGSGMHGGQLRTRMRIIGEVIHRHMLEEERPDGFFAAIRATGMDLQSLGQCMRLRRYLLQNGAAPRARRMAAPARIASANRQPALETMASIES
jgi:hypothetical protein